MTDMISEAQAVLESTLNSEVMSPDSLYGLFIIAVIAYLAIRGVKRVTSSLGSIIGFILFLEIGHVCAFSTTLGAQAPILQTIFKYDVLTALAQLCVGTQISSFLLYVQAWLNAVMQKVVDTAAVLGQFVMCYIESTGVLKS